MMDRVLTPSYAPISTTQMAHPAAIPFEDAAASYIKYGGDNRYLPRVVEFFHGRPLASIHPFDVRQMAVDLYPDAINATRNRQALTPARAVLIHGYERGWCNLMRLRRFKEDPPKRKKPASPVWLHAFARQCTRDDLPHVAAIVLFMAETAARVSEAVNLQWSEVDLANRRVVLRKTKTSVNSVRHLTDEMVARLHKLQIGQGRNDRVFRYQCRHSVNERIKAVCERADISYKSSHACGRHSFATSAIDNGIDIKTAMDAGGWRSVEVFLGTYVHPRHNAGRIVADCFSAKAFDADL